MDGITLHYMARELNERLTGARIDKIQQPERDEVILSLRCPGENVSLLISCSAGCERVHLTQTKKLSPLEPGALCMLLRKHLLGGRITGVKQLNADRVIAITAEHTDELGDRGQKTILCEFMGKHSNIVLLSAEGRILECARHVNETLSTFREVLPGLMYSPPPAHGKMDFDALDVREAEKRLAGQSGRLAKIIQSNISGLNMLLAQEAAFRVCGDADACTDDAGMLAPAIVKSIKDMISSPSYAIVQTPDGEAQALEAFEYLSWDGFVRAKYTTLSEAADAFYSLRDARERMRQKSASLTKLIKNNIERVEKKLTLQQQAYDDAENSGVYRIKGEMLMASPYLVKKGMKQVSLPNYYDEAGGSITVELDEKSDAQGNAQRYFKLYKKAQVARKLALSQLESGRSELDYLEGQMENLSLCTDESSLAELRQELIKTGYIREALSRRQTKALPASKPMEFFAPDGTRILAGRNNLQNESLTFGSQPEEIWLHAKNVPGSHVIIKSETPSDETILYAASVAARYSGARTSLNVEVDATRAKYVKKPSGARPGFVNYSHQRTVVVRPLEDKNTP